MVWLLREARVQFRIHLGGQLMQRSVLLQLITCGEEEIEAAIGYELVSVMAEADEILADCKI